MSVASFSKGTGQSWVVPTGVTSIVIDAAGAQGQNSIANSSGYTYGGNGARIHATMSVTPGQTLYLSVGGQDGTNGGGSTSGGGGLYQGTPGKGGGMTWLSNSSSTFSQGSVNIVAGGGGGGGANGYDGGVPGRGGVGGGGGYGGDTTGTTNGTGGAAGGGTGGGTGSTGSGGYGGAFGGGGGAGYWSGGGGATGLANGAGGNAPAGSDATTGVTGSENSYYGSVGGGGGGGGSSYYSGVSLIAGTPNYQAGDGYLTISFAISLTFSVSDAENSIDTATLVEGALQPVFVIQEPELITESLSLTLILIRQLSSSDSEVVSETLQIFVPLLAPYIIEQESENDFAILRILDSSPHITFRMAYFPYGLLPNPFTYDEDIANQVGLPILSGNYSVTKKFRIYNNYDLAGEISTAYNLTITTYDNTTHSASSPLSTQQWINFQENGYGVNSTVSNVFTEYLDEPVFVGGPVNIKGFTVGADGNLGSNIPAGSNTDGCGFIEVNTFAWIPAGQLTSVVNGVITVQYDWSS